MSDRITGFVLCLIVLGACCWAISQFFHALSEMAPFVRMMG